MVASRSPRLLLIAILVCSCIGNMVPCSAQPQSNSPAEVVHIPVTPLPFVLKGFLRHPEGSRHFPAIVLLPACGRFAEQLDENWGTQISSWGYVTLTIDGFEPRGIRDCGKFANTATGPSDLVNDAYRGLDFLIKQRFVDAGRVGVVGFATGAWQALAAVEPGAIQRASEHKFRAAAAFYPLCSGFSGTMSVPTLILIGERDDWGTADACRKMVAGEDDVGISRQKSKGAEVRLIVYPDTYFAFDVPTLHTPIQLLGHHLEFNKSAADQSAEALRGFLDTTVRDASNR